MRLRALSGLLPVNVLGDADSATLPDREIPVAMPTSEDRSRNLTGRNSLFGDLFRARELCILLITPEGVPSSITFV
jgi:hypothetical protein